MIRGRRFHDEDVERSAGDFARLERIGERGFIDNSAASAIDDAHALFHFRECCGADQAAGVVGQRGVNGNEIGACEKLVEAYQLDADSSGGLGSEDRIVANHFHLEAESAIGDDSPDVAQADDAESLVEYLCAGEFHPIPIACAQRRVGRGNVPRQRHHHRDRVLGGGHAVAGRTVHHDDSAPRGSFDIDVVHADARASDHLEQGGGVDYFAGDAGGTPDEQRVVGRDYLRQLFRLEPGLEVEG